MFYLFIYSFVHLLIMFLKIKFTLITEYLLMIRETELFEKPFLFRPYNVFVIVSKFVR